MRLRRPLKMDDLSTINIPFDTWLRKKSRIMVLHRHLRESDLHLVEGREDDLIQRLQVLLFMARRAVIDLIRNA